MSIATGTRKRSRISPLHDAVNWCKINKDKNGFVIKYIDSFIGSGVYTTRRFLQKEFLVEYAGNLLSYKEGVSVEKKYKKDPSIGSFLYFFDCRGKKYCVDGTYSDSMGKMINDATGKDINCIPKVVIVDGYPRICFFAAKDLEINTELRYNYGDGLSLPWRKKRVVKATSKQAAVSNDGMQFENPVFNAKRVKTYEQVDTKESSHLKGSFIKFEGFQSQLYRPNYRENMDISNFMVFQNILNDDIVPPSRETDNEKSEIIQIVKKIDNIENGEHRNDMKGKNPDLSSLLKENFRDVNYSSPQAQSNSENDHLVKEKAQEKENEQQKVSNINLQMENDDTREDTKGAQRDLRSTETLKQTSLAVDSTRQGEIVIPLRKTCNEKSEIIEIIKELDNIENFEHIKDTKENFPDLSNSLVDDFSNDGGSEYHPTKASVQDELSELRQDFSDENMQTQCIYSDGIQTVKEKEGKKAFEQKKACNSNFDIVDNATGEEKTKENSDFSSTQTCKLKSLTPDSTCQGKIHVQEKVFGSSKKGADKKHCCLYCQKIIPQMPRHLKKKHSNEIEVARALSLSVEKEKILLLRSLIYKGDYQHNYDVIETGQGTVIPRYSKRKGSKKNKSLEELVPCEHCKALYVCTEFYRHKCPLKPVLEDAQSGCSGGVKSARLLLPLPFKHKNHSHLYRTVICNMQDGEVKLVVEKDSLIKDFGSRQLESVDKDVSNTQAISTKMRELGRLMVAFLEIDSEITLLKYAILPINWEKLLTAIKNVAGYNVSSGRYQIPSLALKLGYSLKHCANIAYCQAIMDWDETARKNYSDFLQLYNTEFYTRISSKAQYTLHIDKFNKPLLLPLSEDVTTLHNHLKKEVLALIMSPEPNYQDLAEAVLAQVILFNRKRSGEAQRMKLQHYQNALKSSVVPPDKEVLKTLSKFEAALCTNILRVEIRGKRGRKVPVLLTEEMKNGVNMFIKLRKNPDVQPKMDYLFARPLDAKTPFYGNVAIRKHAILSGAKQPELLTSTGLRKQLGTMCQILALDEQQQDVLTNFMGHDIQIHREFYRLPQSYIEVAKVTKILHAINEGRISEFKGKDYDSIMIHNGDTVEYEEDDIEEDITLGEDEDKLVNNETQDTKNAITTVIKVKGRQPVKKRKYTEQQQKTITTVFKSNIQREKEPGKLAIENAKREHSCLADIPWKLIKYYVKNLIAKRKTLPKLQK